MEKLKLKINHIIFWLYYKRVPKFFHKWQLLKSISMLKQNYEHEVFLNSQKDEIISSAIKTESKMMEENSNLKLRLLGVKQSELNGLNKMFGTNLNGISDEEVNN